MHNFARPLDRLEMDGDRLEMDRSIRENIWPSVQLFYEVPSSNPCNSDPNFNPNPPRSKDYHQHLFV